MKETAGAQKGLTSSRVRLSLKPKGLVMWVKALGTSRPNNKGVVRMDQKDPRPVRAWVGSSGYPKGAGCQDLSKMVDYTTSGGVPWLVQAFGSSENQDWTTEVCQANSGYWSGAGSLHDGEARKPTVLDTMRKVQGVGDLPNISKDFVGAVKPECQLGVVGVVDRRLAIRLEVEEDPIANCELALMALLVSTVTHAILNELQNFTNEGMQGIAVTKCDVHDVCW
ncbi:hypothetical protein D8674_024116 [Pyrus ussuriensis x Pyrus communis]|uniref:Uncharacterized protein n=1 Tax=Pyrus ussuriensis x Pyrus communis TaxID=2448454 RepID=A0A5N5HFK2_9ROSA|nr:hypothetical protein D8674_024116 [Pyrus ussuriensis x Pyrus communis]